MYVLGSCVFCRVSVAVIVFIWIIFSLRAADSHELPPLQPRYYSAANSPLAHPGKLHLAFTVVDFGTDNNLTPYRNSLVYLNGMLI
jgi:hypothetical protein